LHVRAEDPRALEKMKLLSTEQPCVVEPTASPLKCTYQETKLSINE